MTQAHILLADDDTVLAELLTEYLQGEGFKITLVHNGADALEATKTPKDMIILDIMMPRMDGLEVLKAVRQNGNRGQQQQQAEVSDSLPNRQFLAQFLQHFLP